MSGLELVRRVVVVGLLSVGVGCAVENRNPRCDLHPAAGDDFGVADVLIGYYFRSEVLRCEPVSGDACDDECRETKVPFDTLEECEDVCIR